VLAEAARLTQEVGEVFASVLLLYLQSGAYLLSGRLSAAQAILQRALEMASDPKGRLPVAGLPLVGLGLVAWERNELDAAIHYLTEGIPLADQYRGTMAFVEGYVTLAKVRLALGDTQDAHAALGEAQRFAKELGSPHLTHEIDAVWAELVLRQGDLKAAKHWVDEQAAIYRDELPRLVELDSQEVHTIQQFTRIWRVWARVMIVDGEPRRALALLDEILTDARGKGMKHKVIEVEMLRSLAFQAEGEIECAISCLQEALTLAEPEGYVSMFVNEGPAMARLLYTAAERGITPSFTSCLIAAFPAYQEMPQQSVHGEPLIEPLSAREREVLQLLEEGLSNREVAERLIISLSTVKSHTASIFAKLDVHSRARAITRARGLGLTVT
jgi:LuxR family maltose regulon positive regulatory protein